MEAEQIIIPFICALLVGVISWGLVDLARIVYAVLEEKHKLCNKRNGK